MFVFIVSCHSNSLNGSSNSINRYSGSCFGSGDYKVDYEKHVMTPRTPRCETEENLFFCLARPLRVPKTLKEPYHSYNLRLSGVWENSYQPGRTLPRLLRPKIRVPKTTTPV